MSSPASQETVIDLHKAVANDGIQRVASALGVHAATIHRALAGARLSPDTIRKLAKLSPKVRTADEFRAALAGAHRHPIETAGPFTWDLEKIRSARNAQMIGDFKVPAQLAASMRTDDAIFAARSNRIAPQNAIAALLKPHDSARGRAIAAAANVSVSTPRRVLAGINGTLADHGVAFGYNRLTVNADGTRIDLEHVEWPIEFVKRDYSKRRWETSVEGGSRVPIYHGDGRFVVYEKFGVSPWREDAALLPAAFVWAAHANGVSDWAGSSRAHGLAQILGTLPEGTALQDADGALTPQATLFLDLITRVASGEIGAGIIPPGAKADFLSNGSTAWQIFLELITNREKAAARIYLGTDAMLGSIGGAPGVDIAALFGVATTKIQGDLTAIEDGLRTGVFQPWAAMNYGDSRLAPSLEYQMPDPDESRKINERSDRLTKLLDALERYAALGFVLDQATVNQLATSFGVDAVPTLAPTEEKRIPIALAPTDVGKVVRAQEARASQGLPPFGDERDALTITQLEAAANAAPAAPAPPPAAPATPAPAPAPAAPTPAEPAP